MNCRRGPGCFHCQLVPTKAGLFVRVVQLVPLFKPDLDWTAKLKSDTGQERRIFPPLTEALIVGLPVFLVMPALIPPPPAYQSTPTSPGNRRSSWPAESR